MCDTFHVSLTLLRIPSPRLPWLDWLSDTTLSSAVLLVRLQPALFTYICHISWVVEFLRLPWLPCLHTAPPDSNLRSSPFFRSNSSHAMTPGLTLHLRSTQHRCQLLFFTCCSQMLSLLPPRSHQRLFPSPTHHRLPAEGNDLVLTSGFTFSPCPCAKTWWDSMITSLPCPL